MSWVTEPSIHLRDPACRRVAVTDRAKAIDGGAVDFLRKPLDAQRVIDLIQQSTQTAVARPAGVRQAAHLAEVTAQFLFEGSQVTSRLVKFTLCQLRLFGEFRHQALRVLITTGEGIWGTSGRAR